jgi:hypothetical protein
MPAKPKSSPSTAAAWSACFESAIAFAAEPGVLCEKPQGAVSKSASRPSHAKINKCATLESICELIEPMSRPTLVGVTP